MKRKSHSVFDPQGQRKYLTIREGKAFLTAVERFRRDRRIFCEVIYYTGIRISEALSLTPMNLDSEAGVLLVRTLKKRKYATYRRIPIPWWLVKALSNMEAETPTSRFWRFSRTTGWRIVKTGMATAEIHGIHSCPKGLRHGYAARSIERNVPLPTLQTLLGHADLSSTAVYLQAKDGELRMLVAPTWK